MRRTFSLRGAALALDAPFPMAAATTLAVVLPAPLVLAT